MEFKFGGKEPPLILFGVTSVDMALPLMSKQLPADVILIATKSRRFSIQGKNFIVEKVQRLLKHDIAW